MPNGTSRDWFQKWLEEFKENIDGMLEDHEHRIRALEDRMSKAIGALGLIGMIATIIAITVGIITIVR